MNFNTKMKFQKGINNHLWHMYRIRSHQNTAYSSQGNERGSMNSHRPTPLISLTSLANTGQDFVLDYSFLYPTHERLLSADEHTDYSYPQITYRLFTFSNYLQTNM